MLVSLGLIPLLIIGKKKDLKRIIFALIILILASLYILNAAKKDVVYIKDGIYEEITVYDKVLSGRPTRFFQQDRSSSGAMYLDSNDPKDLVYDYSKYYSLYKIFNPEINNALVIGGGAYSIPKALLADLPNATVDVSEIEPSLFNIAKQYFNLENNPRLHNYTKDGRRLLNDSKKNYDLIFSDVYYSLFSIPAHFTTQEFFSLAKNKLNENGIFMANIIGDLSQQQPSLIMSEIKTFRTIFPNSYFFATKAPDNIKPQNIIFVGYKSNKRISLHSQLITTNSDPIIRSIEEKQIDISKFDLTPYPILTDNYSPVEFLTSRVLQRSINHQN